MQLYIPWTGWRSASALEPLRCVWPCVAAPCVRGCLPSSDDHTTTLAAQSEGHSTGMRILNQYAPKSHFYSTSGSREDVAMLGLLPTL